MKGQSIDLIYLDPPFNKKRNFYGTEKTISENAFFKDRWTENDVDLENAFSENNSDALFSFLKSVEKTQDKSAKYYIAYMALRLFEMRRILKNTGSICLHSDHSMSHYLKILLDIIFGASNFRNEIVWCYKQGGRSEKTLPRKHDIIFWYSKTNDWIFNADDIRIAYDETSMYAKGGIRNPKTGKRYMPNPKGKIPEDFWYIPALNPLDKERLGYPTQKPLFLLERIIRMLSNENDLVLDPFCGSGSTCVSAERLQRNWIGIDISKEACDIIKKRIKNEFGIDLEVRHAEEK